MDSNEQTIIDIENIEDLDTVLEHANNNKLLVVLDASAKWCKPCKAIEPLFNQLSKNTDFNAYIIFLKTDIDIANDIVDKYDIKNIPYFLLFFAKEQINSFKGTDITQLKNLLKESINKYVI